MKRGLLIAVCGLDGAGKTTQINLLNNWFETNKLPCEITKQPTDYYRNDRRVRRYLDHGECQDMKVLALLAAADRRYHLSAYIEPSIKRGMSIITDRYLYSSLAYFKFRGLEHEYVKYLNGDIREPDITIFLDIDPEITLLRVRNRDGQHTKYEEKDPRMFTEIRNHFKEVLPATTLLIDATLDKQTIHERIVSEVSNKQSVLNGGVSVGIK
ncbi:dTMP kinase [Metabacillus schmidteae]|uniref:dTMP kinase n=1 Tax=Metabacillus schmidteae TaxID=2730405 RepID=UPI0015895131|nr:dTMP kinase [Metabacillus schmidteae]